MPRFRFRAVRFRQALHIGGQGRTRRRVVPADRLGVRGPRRVVALDVGDQPQQRAVYTLRAVGEARGRQQPNPRLRQRVALQARHREPARGVEQKALAHADGGVGLELRVHVALPGRLREHFQHEVRRAELVGVEFAPRRVARRTEGHQHVRAQAAGDPFAPLALQVERHRQVEADLAVRAVAGGRAEAVDEGVAGVAHRLGVGFDHRDRVLAGRGVVFERRQPLRQRHARVPPRTQRLLAKGAGWLAAHGAAWPDAGLGGFGHGQLLLLFARGGEGSAARSPAT